VKWFRQLQNELLKKHQGNYLKKMGYENLKWINCPRIGIQKQLLLSTKIHP
jgi:hypothetical protein